MQNGIVVLIPAYKPIDGLVNFLSELSSNNSIVKIIVINDGSGEQFENVFQMISTLNKVDLLTHAVNLGKGAALKTGFNYFLLLKNECTLITADADGQHSIEDILKVGKKALEHQNKNEFNYIVLGAREFDKNVPLRSSFGNNLTKKIFWIFSGLKLKDTQTGLRAYSKELLRNCMKIKNNKYDFELEALLVAKAINCKFSEVVIKTIYIDNNSSSHFNPIRDSLLIYLVFFRFVFSSLLIFLIDLIVFTISYKINSNLVYSMVLSRTVTTGVAFFLATNFVFKGTGGSKIIALLKYCILVITFGFLSVQIIHFLNFKFNIPIPVAKILAETGLYFVNFAVQRELIFKSEE